MQILLFENKQIKPSFLVFFSFPPPLMITSESRYFLKIWTISWRTLLPPVIKLTNWVVCTQKPRYLHGCSAYRQGSWLKVFVCLCDSKVNFPNNLKSELKRGCGKNCVQLLGRGLFFNGFLSLRSRRVRRQWKRLGVLRDVSGWSSESRVLALLPSSVHPVWSAKQDDRKRCNNSWAQIKLMMRKRHASSAVLKFLVDIHADKHCLQYFTMFCIYTHNWHS